MSNIPTVYNYVHDHIKAHFEQLVIRLQHSTSLDFFKLSIVQKFEKLFVSFLTFLATFYEIIRYFTSHQFTEILTTE